MPSCWSCLADVISLLTTTTVKLIISPPTLRTTRTCKSARDSKMLGRRKAGWRFVFSQLFGHDVGVYCAVFCVPTRVCRLCFVQVGLAYSSISRY
jgi:hypothetical protein